MTVHDPYLSSWAKANETGPSITRPGLYHWPWVIRPVEATGSKTLHDPHPSATLFLGVTDNSWPSSLAHDPLAKYLASKWLNKQRREYEANHEVAKAEEVSASVAVSERRESNARLEGKMTVTFSG